MKVFSAIMFFLMSSVLTMTAQVGGGNGFEFLNLPYSAHSAALGGENVSLIEDDPALAYQNPALLQSVSHNTLGIGYMKYMEGVNAFSSNYVYAINDTATIGVCAQYVDYGKMKHTDVNNNIIGEFGAADLAIGGQLSYYLGKNFVGGISAKFIYSHIAEYSSTAVAVDLGINYYDPNKDLSLSLVARNLGGQLSAYYEDFERLPFNLQAGITKRLIGTPLRISVTGSDLQNWDYGFMKHITVGADLLLGQQFYVSAGYNFRTSSDLSITTTDSWGDENKSSHGAGLSFGGGLNLDRFKVSVAYTKYHVAASSLLLNLALTL